MPFGVTNIEINKIPKNEVILKFFNIKSFVGENEMSGTPLNFKKNRYLTTYVKCWEIDLSSYTFEIFFSIAWKSTALENLVTLIENSKINMKDFYSECRNISKKEFPLITEEKRKYFARFEGYIPVTREIYQDFIFFNEKMKKECCVDEFFHDINNFFQDINHCN